MPPIYGRADRLRVGIETNAWDDWLGLTRTADWTYVPRRTLLAVTKRTSPLANIETALGKGGAHLGLKMEVWNKANSQFFSPEGQEDPVLSPDEGVLYFYTTTY